MSASESFERCSASRFLPWHIAHVGLVAFVCCLTPHVSAAEPSVFAYRNPCLLVTKGTATITDLAGVRKTVQGLANDYAEKQKPGADQPLPCVAILSGGQLVETSADSEATIFDPAVGTVLLQENASVRVSPAPDQPKASGAGSSLELLKGRLSIRVDAEKLRKVGNSTEFRLRMPKNILAVKGTEFAAIHEGGATGVVMTRGAVALQSIDGKPIALLDLKKSKPTLYRIDAQGMISGAEEYKDVASLRIPQDFLEAEPNFQKRKITLRLQESARKNVPEQIIDFSKLTPADTEGVVRWTYDWKPDEDRRRNSHWRIILLIELPDRFRASPTGLLLKVKSSVKLEGALLSVNLANKRGSGSSHCYKFNAYKVDREQELVQLGGADGWQALYLPLTEQAIGGDPGKSELRLYVERSKIPKAFEMDIAPIFLTVPEEPTK